MINMTKNQWIKTCCGIALFTAATFAFFWFAGFIFFLICKSNPLGKVDFTTWLSYWNGYQDNISVVKKLKTSAILSALFTYGGPLYLLLSSLHKSRSLHGEARFANTSEIKKAGLFAATGIIVGKTGRKYLTFSGMQFVLLAAPTRSRKGVGIVIPNLLSWPESVVSLDVKLENFLITSKFREKFGQEVYLFNPFSISEDGRGNPVHGKTHRYNPLGYISDDKRLRVTDILAIGYSLYPGEGKDAFFDDAARNLFLGLTLYLCETPSLPRTMGELLRQSSGKGQPVKDYIQNFIKERNFHEVGEIILDDAGTDKEAVARAIIALSAIEIDEARELCEKTPICVAQWVAKKDFEQVKTIFKDAGAEITLNVKLIPRSEDSLSTGQLPLSMECVDALNRFTSTSDNTLSSIMATFNVPLTLWASPIVDAATSANDFDLRDVRKKLMSIYLGIPANKLAEAKIMLNMFYTQLINLNTNQLLYSTPELKYTCLLLNDEFAAPGRIAAIDNSNSFQAGYGMRLLTIVQSPGQLEAPAPKGYGKENARTFITNHACQIFYTPRVQEDAEEYSKALGYYTFKAKGESKQIGGNTNGNRSESHSDQRRALMLPQELKEMSIDKQIINLENTKPIFCDKICYFADHVFIDRLKSVSPSLAILGKKLPSKEQLEAAWGSGECAVSIPALNFDLHEARVQNRSREITLESVKTGIDLDSLAIDFSKVPIPEGDNLEPDQVEAFVKGFFDALDEVNDYEDTNESDASVFEIEVIKTEPENAESVPVDNSSPIEDFENQVEDFDSSEYDFEATSDDYMPDEYAIPDDGEFFEGFEEMNPPPSFADLSKSTPIVDLSVLQKPLSTRRKASGQRI